MTDLRTAKIKGIAGHLKPQEVENGPDGGKLAVVGWGSTYGPISRAIDNLLNAGEEVSHIHLRYIWPLPANLKKLLGRYDRVFVPEMNDGQLVKLLRSEYLVDAEGFSKVTGQPFKIAELETAIRGCLEK